MKCSLGVRSLAALFAAAVICLGPIGARAATDSATYTYDSNGRLWTVTYANGTMVTYTYDTAGNRLTVTTTCSGTGC